MARADGWRPEEIVCVALFVFVAVVLPCCMFFCTQCNPYWNYDPRKFECCHWSCCHLRWPWRRGGRRVDALAPVDFSEV
jgi:hypothetical protein